MIFRQEIDRRLSLLAHARYPKVPILLAMSYYESDRRAAGLGALDPRRRRGRTIMRTKEIDLLHRRVIYTLRTKLPPRDVPPAFDELLSVGAAGDARLTITRLAAVDVARCVALEAHDLDTQRGRDMAAKMLRQARQELQQERAS